jgi:hypothetical protein
MQTHERQQMIRAMASDDIESVLQLGRDLQMFDYEPGDDKVSFTKSLPAQLS